MNPSNTIILNVGGKKIETLRSPLQKIPYFEACFRTYLGVEKQEIFIDVDYDIFKHVLNYIRSNGYMFPKDAVLCHNIIDMINYLGIKPETTQN